MPARSTQVVLLKEVPAYRCLYLMDTSLGISPQKRVICLHVLFCHEFPITFFEGKVDEAEVASLRVGTPLKVSLGAIEDQELDASLQFIAPKGTEEQGAVQFKIEADMVLNDSILCSVCILKRDYANGVKYSWIVRGYSLHMFPDYIHV